MFYINHLMNEGVFKSSFPEQKCFTKSLSVNAFFFSKRNSTNTPSFRHSKECAFHQIRLILKMKYERILSRFISNHTKFLRTILCLIVPSKTAWNLEGLQRGESKPVCFPPSHPRLQSPPQLGRFNADFEIQTSASRETERTNRADASGAGAPRNRFCPVRPRLSFRGLPRPNPTRRVPGVRERRHGPQAPTPAGAAVGSTLGVREDRGS